MWAALGAIEYYLPENVLTNGQLNDAFPEWSIDKIEKKTGICSRHIASVDETASDLAVSAVNRLFSTTGHFKNEIDYIIYCTQSPDYHLPSTSCILQDRLGFPSSVGSIDINLGCSGYIYGLGLAKGLIETQQARNVLFITAETYSKYIHPTDKSIRTIFGDAASATLIKSINESLCSYIGPFEYGTDGRGADNLIVHTGGMRHPKSHQNARLEKDAHGNIRTQDNLYMNGQEIFTFTLRTIPVTIKKLLIKANCTLDEIDYFVFHQANKEMLEHLRKKIKIPQDKFIIELRDCGNTVSSSIPIALCEINKKDLLKSGQKVMLVGFGVGYSWGATIVRWNPI